MWDRGFQTQMCTKNGKTNESNKVTLDETKKFYTVWYGNKGQDAYIRQVNF